MPEMMMMKCLNLLKQVAFNIGIMGYRSLLN